MKQYNFQIFIRKTKIHDKTNIICFTENTRNGFKHVAVVEGRSEFFNTKINYINRTWESFKYESVLNKLLNIIEEKIK